MTCYTLNEDCKRTMTSKHTYCIDTPTYMGPKSVIRARDFSGTPKQLKAFVKRQLKVDNKSNWLLEVNTSKGRYYFTKAIV